MKVISKTLVLALIPAAILFQPLNASAQKKKERKEQKEMKEEKEMKEPPEMEADGQKQLIIITRTADPKEKTVVEVKDGKVSINGKAVEEGRTDDVDVKVIDIPSGASGWGTFAPGAPQQLARVGVGQNMQLFGEANNRALLGVVTETDEKGVEIKEVTDESAADKAGLKKGDIIQSIDETKIERPDQLAEVIAENEPGDEVTVHYSRDGKDMTAKAELGKWKGFSQSFSWNDDNQELHNLAIAPRMRYERGYFDMDRPRLGISVQETEDGKGVQIIDVNEEDLGGKAGLQEGDLITKVEDVEINSADKLAAIVRTNLRENKPINFQIQRNGKNETITVKIPRKLKTADL